jgi:nitroreductase
MSEANPRKADYPVDPRFVERWSPRAFTGEALPLEKLMGLFEAARWAPSAMNAQPWRFAYALRGTPGFDRFLSVLAPGNQVWASRASALVALAASRFLVKPGTEERVPSASHAFDAGAAWAQLALQAHAWGLATHAMGGFDRDEARKLLEVPDDLDLQGDDLARRRRADRRTVAAVHVRLGQVEQQVDQPLAATYPSNQRRQRRTDAAERRQGREKRGEGIVLQADTRDSCRYMTPRA